MEDNTKESIIATPGSGVNSIEIVPKEVSPLRKGGFEPKYMVIADVLSNKRSQEPSGQAQEARASREVTLVFKKPGIISADEYIENWRIAKQAGLPVINTLRKIDEETVAMMDLTADGSKFYGNIYAKSLRLKEQTVNLDDPIDSIFLRVIDNDSEVIRKKLEDYVELANKNSVELPRDDCFELLVHPDGSWNVVLLDLTELFKVENDSSDSWIRSNLEKVQQFEFIENRIRDHILQARS